MEYVAQQPCVICFSHDSTLLMTRQWLLEQEKYDVIPVLRAKEFRDKLQSHPITLIILCQSLKSEECQEADIFAIANKPDARILVLFGLKQKYVPERECVMLDAKCGPLTFLSTVRGMLTQAEGLTRTTPVIVN